MPRATELVGTASAAQVAEIAETKIDVDKVEVIHGAVGLCCGNYFVVLIAEFTIVLLAETTARGSLQVIAVRALFELFIFEHFTTHTAKGARVPNFFQRAFSSISNLSAIRSQAAGQRAAVWSDLKVSPRQHTKSLGILEAMSLEVFFLHIKKLYHKKLGCLICVLGI